MPLHSQIDMKSFSSSLHLRILEICSKMKIEMICQRKDTTTFLTKPGWHIERDYALLNVWDVILKCTASFKAILTCPFIPELQSKAMGFSFSRLFFPCLPN